MTSMSVCLSMCLSLCDNIFGTTCVMFNKFCVHVTMAMAWSSSGGVLIHYVFPVLWMMSYLHIS